MSAALWNSAFLNAASGLELFANAADTDNLPPEHPSLETSRPAETDEQSSSSPGPPAELCLYRKRTISLLRRYARLSIETGRLPSALGGCDFRAKVSSYPLHTFEDAVIFVFDVERCLGELSAYEYEVIARIVLRGESPERAAREIQCTERSVFRCIPDALDKLTKKFLRKALLSRSDVSPKSCQGGKNGFFDVSS